MTNLEGLDPYTSYCLHWFPYEIIRCNKLKRSRVSTRALSEIANTEPRFLACLACRLTLNPYHIACAVGRSRSTGPLKWGSL